MDAMDEAEKARTEAEKTVMQATARAEQACAAPTVAPLLWQAGHMPGVSDSRQTDRRTGTAPTRAPTAPALPDRTSLSTACGVHVSSTSGTDSDACGEASETPCHSIQKGIERAGNYNTVCVHEGELPKQHCAYSQLTMYLQVAIVVGLVGQEPSHEASCCAALMQ